VGPRGRKAPTRSSYVDELPGSHGLFLTLLMLKTDMDEETLAAMFHYRSFKKLYKAFTKYIIVMDEYLCAAMPYPTAEQIDACTPERFKKYVKDLEIILDCTDVFTEVA
jgi:hypothetical protein